VGMGVREDSCTRERLYTLVRGCESEWRCVSESVYMGSRYLGCVSGGVATVISLGIRFSLGFRIRHRVGIRCRTPHNTHWSVTHIYYWHTGTFELGSSGERGISRKSILFEQKT